VTYDSVAQFAYSRARALIAPEVRNSHYAYADRLRAALREGAGRWLDIGCGHDFLPEWMAPRDRVLRTKGWTVTGIDMDRASIARHLRLRHRIVANGEQLPFEDRSFDLITANMVIEHVANPPRLLAEISRTLAPNGRVVLHTPNLNGYTTRLTRLLPEKVLAPLAGVLLGRKAEDVYPTYYRANSIGTLRTLADAHGLTVEACDLVNSSPQTMRVPPLMLLELLMMRSMRSPRYERLRACLLVTLRKLGDGVTEIVSGSEIGNLQTS